MIQGTGHRQGRSFPLGATVHPDGVNFSVFSRYATALELLLFENADDLTPSRAILLDPQWNRTYYYWHVFVPGLTAGQLYGYRAHGPFEPQEGLRFNPAKVLLDLYGKCLARPDSYNRRAACQPANHAPTMKSVVVDPGAYDWRNDALPRIPFARTLLYELHVGGFTRHPTSGVALDRRGTYAGLVEKIPYLQDLGVTAVELLPVYAFDEQDAPPGLANYWGYSPISFFAPHAAYSSRRNGFTLNDVVSYNDKPNEANREANRDGPNDNRSWNCGVEGPTDDPDVQRLRNRQVKNFLALTLLSAGTPMLLMGDEVRRSQGGNNNAYCQDNEISWFDWSLVDKHADVRRFTQMLIALRVNRDLPANRLGMTLNELLHHVPVQWHGVKLNHPGWGNEAHTLSATVRMLEGRVLMHLMVNAYWEALDFEVPSVEVRRAPWRRCLDTFLDSPDDIREWADAPVVKDPVYWVQPRCVVVLVARHEGQEDAGHRLASPQ
jgi:pullulanase/glycogen debranching enzyme